MSPAVDCINTALSLSLSLSILSRLSLVSLKSPPPRTRTKAKTKSSGNLPSYPPLVFFLMETTEAPLPLLDANQRSKNGGGGGGATSAQTLGNIVVSLLGTGALGLPYAFRVSGWLSGSLGLAAAAAVVYYCMLLLIRCRNKLEEGRDKDGAAVQIQTYGDLGAEAFGVPGRCLTEVLVVISYAGTTVSYLFFMGENLSSVFSSYGISPSAFVFALLLPLEAALSFIRSFSVLAPFSILADACNVLAMAIVLAVDVQQLRKPSGKAKRSAFNGAWSLPFAGGVAVFCFEAFGLTLSLEASMAERKKFPWVLLQAFLGTAAAYICFGVFGYLAYGEDTNDIITLNLPSNWLASIVKVGLCIALAFTFPMIIHPVNEIIENKLDSSEWFQKLCQNLPGSTVCALLAFVLPATFHLKLLGSSSTPLQRVLDYSILATGLVFAGYSIYSAVSGHSMGFMT
ncbi:amino acid transporter ANT1-like isoform X2 [Phoenix dactylifera]|uniref:Amino acid transporter ANT1-like isoform X2 n=1 Tax=Phoenix dactylifera TaxID=42345 RepID=A0A8B8J7D7_PHODC|nr:amino acid transporter ANT1-like isoform X2 [Phoenix dactylifera]